MKKHAKIVQADRRGQIVIPKSVRSELDIREGDAFWVYTVEDGIVLKRVEAPSSKSVKKLIKGVKK